MLVVVIVSVAAWLSTNTLAQIPNTPCPDIFQYILGPDNIWRGEILIWPPPQTIRITVRVHEFLTAALPSKYAGRLMLADDKDIVAQKILAGRNDRIRYELLFPLTRPLPTIDHITINQDIVCKGPRVSAPILTKISLEHTLLAAVTPSSGVNNIVPVVTSRPPQGRPEQIYPWLTWDIFKPKPEVPQKPFQPQPPYQQSTPPYQQPTPPLQTRPLPPTQAQPSTRPEMQPPTPRPPSQPKPTRTVISTTPETFVQFPGNPPLSEKPHTVAQATTDICGRSVLANELIVHGKRTYRGEWPWIAAVFFSSSIGNLQFQCGATLFNKRHVITAGHCVKMLDEDDTYTEVHPSQLVVYVGMYSLRRIADAFSQPREVQHIYIHPDFQTTSSYDADLAVLKLSNSVEYTQYVRPICLWPFTSDLDPVVGKLGTIVGWGMDEKGHKSSSEPRRTDVPIVSQFECLRNKTEFVAITSDRTFCAGFRNDTGPCNGDSGSGLILKYTVSKNTRWYLRGITSVSLYDRRENRCDLRNYVVFTDVAKFDVWIKQFMAKEFL